MQTVGSEIGLCPSRFFTVPDSFIEKELALSQPTIHSHKGKEHASLYRKYRFPPSPEIPKLAVSFLKEKNEGPFAVVVDIGCGSGQSTRGLAPYFQKVVGVEVSEAQIAEAKQITINPKISYCISAADQLPFEDGLVDLVTSTTAVQWFNLEKFLKEADRILKPNGCLALQTLSSYIPLYYKDRSERLSAVFKEAMEFLFSYAHECFSHIRNRVDDIAETFPMTVSEMMGFLKSLYMYQTYKALDPEGARTFLPKTQRRILETMGVTSMDTKVDFVAEYYFIVACKPI